jgi:L-malate glycosyltransferase
MSSCEQAIRDDVDQNHMRDVVLVGSVRSVEDYLRCADIFVFPTIEEAFGIALIEAMACGLPVIASHVGAIKEIVTPGLDGITVPPGEYRPLFEALNRLLSSPVEFKYLGENAAQTVRLRYSRQLVSRKYFDLFLGAHS